MIRLMLRWLARRLILNRPWDNLPKEAEAAPTPLGLEGEALLLLRAYEGLGSAAPLHFKLPTSGNVFLPRVGRAVERADATLDAHERTRWMGDADAWARSALGTRTPGPAYRDGGERRVDAAVHQIASRVAAAVAHDDIDAAAAALAEYVGAQPNSG